MHQETVIPYLDLGFTRFSLVLFFSFPMVARSPIVVQFAMGASDCVPVLVASSCVEVDALLFKTCYKRFKERYEKERKSEIVIYVVIKRSATGAQQGASRLKWINWSKSYRQGAFPKKLPLRYRDHHRQPLPMSSVQEAKSYRNRKENTGTYICERTSTSP